MTPCTRPGLVMSLCESAFLRNTIFAFLCAHVPFLLFSTHSSPPCKTVKAGLLSNPVEFDGVKIRILKLFSNTQKLKRIAVAEPVPYQIVGVIRVPGLGNIRQADEIILLDGFHFHFCAQDLDRLVFLRDHTSSPSSSRSICSILGKLVFNAVGSASWSLYSAIPMGCLLSPRAYSATTLFLFLHRSRPMVGWSC